MKNSKRTNYLLIVLGLIINLNMVFAQVPNWQWAKNVGGGGGDWSKIAVDENGNSYVSGSFASDSITFGSITLTNTGGSSPYGAWDFFIVKYDSFGNVVWAKSFGGNSFDDCNDVVTDANGSVYITGAFLSNTISIGNYTLTRTDTLNSNAADIFVAKFDSAGNAIWAKSAGGSGWDEGNRLAFDLYGNLIVVGNFNSNQIDVGGNTIWTSGAADIFILYCRNNTGNVFIAKSAGGSDGNDYPSAITMDLSGNLCITGLTHSSTIIFDNVTLLNKVADIFVVKYSSNGNVIWAKNAGGNGYDYSKDISTDAAGNLYLTGYVVGDSITFGNITIATVFFITKYDPYGNVIWAQPGVGAATYGMSISTEDNGNSYVVGHFQGDINFGSYNLTNLGVVNIFIVKYNSSGNVIWAKSAGGTMMDFASDVFIDSNSKLYLTGSISSSVANFDNINLTKSINSDADVYISALQDVTCGVPMQPRPITITGGKDKVCPGDTRTYTTGAGNTFYYQWTVPVGAVINSGQGTHIVNITYDNNFTIDGEIRVSKMNSCGASVPSIRSVKRNLAPAPYPIKSPIYNFPICPGATRIYITKKDSAFSFNWTVPTGATIIYGQGTDSIVVEYNSNFTADGFISVAKVNGCGISAYRTLKVFRDHRPQRPSAINGPNFGLCGGRDIVFSVQGNGTYIWTVPGLANITSGQGTNRITVNFQSVNFQKTISVTASGACGTSAARTLTIRSAPEKPGTILGNASVCSNSIGNNYSIDTVYSAVSYTWTGPTGSIISANGITSINNMLTTTASSVSVDFGNITANSTIRVRANNNCGRSAQSSLLLTDCLYLPVCTATVVNNNTLCNSPYNGSAAVTATGGTSPYTYEWRNDNNEIVSNSEIASELPGGNYTVTVTDSFGSTSSCQTSIGGGSAFSLEKHWQYWSEFNTHCEPYCNGYIYVETESELSQSYSYLWNTGATTSSLTGLCGGDNEELVYTVTVTNEAGCQKSISYGIVNNPPMLVIGCQVDQNESYPGAGDGAIYVQSFGYADNSYNGLIDGLSAGTYNFSVTNSGTHCTKSCSCTIVTLNPRLEEDANSSVKKVSARPNPFSDVLKIEVATDEELIITINDVAGREMAVYPNINSSFIVDAKLNAGMYYIVAENKSGSYRKVFKVVRSN